MTTSSHVDQAQVTQLLESVEGCEECLKVGTHGFTSASAS